ncbi:DUF6585 family protein [Streptomyces stramineus]|uniref:Uncharacterized protein n=1 Tax=Streptomyces stramineus TaxID=173861 RepID=A0ABN0ZIA2_9ACTN
MTRPGRPTRGDELLLARISAAAGREHLGKRSATYTGAAHTARTGTLWARGIAALPAFVPHRGPFTAKARDDARLDLYEHGATIAVTGRIHVIRYDTTTVFGTSTLHRHDPACDGTSCALTDIDGKRVVLHGGPEHGDAAEWCSAIQRGVTRAQLPQALAALEEGGRLTFGDIWLTRDEIGYGELRAPWPRVRHLGAREGAVGLDIDGRWHGPGPRAAGVPNLCVLGALAEHLGPHGAR